MKKFLFIIILGLMLTSCQSMGKANKNRTQKFKRRLIYQPQFILPKGAAGGRIPQLFVDVIVKQDGTIIGAKMFKSSGVKSVDNALINNALNCRFEPTKKKGFMKGQLSFYKDIK